MAQVRRFLADSAKAAALGIILLQQPGHGIQKDSALLRSMAVHGQREGAELHGSVSLIGDAGGKALFEDGGGHGGKGLIKPFIIALRQCGGGPIPVHPRLIAELLSQNRGNAGEAPVKGLEDRLRLGREGLLKALPVRVQGVQLVLGSGYEIGLARQDFPEGADGGGDMLDAVDNDSFVITEDDVAVLAHDLHHQSLLPQIPHFVQMLYAQMHDTLQTRLGNVRDAAVLEMLAQEHAEVGGGDGAGLIGLRQVEQGERGVR